MGRLAPLIADKANQGRHQDIRSELSRLENTAVGLAQMVKDLEERLVQASTATQESVNSISIPRYESQLEALTEALRGVQAAVESIDIPEVPPFPEIPPQEKVDLTPILDGLSALDIQPVVNVDPPIVNIDRELREFEFHVERNSAGLIEKVIVKEHG